MPLNTIEISGYRGISEPVEITLAAPDGKRGSGLTIITGANNSGKSSILECLRARNGHQNPSFSSGVRNPKTDEVKIKYTFDGLSEEIKSIRKGSSESVRDKHKVEQVIFVLQSRRNFETFFHRSVTSSRDQYILNDALPAQRSTSLSKFATRLFNIINDENNLKKFNELLYKVLGYKPGWTIDQSEQGQHFLKFVSSGRSHSSDGLGEGIVSIFAIVDSLYDAGEKDIVVIDEPELSLHPALQKRLAETFVELSSVTQIIIATHSPYFVDLDALSQGAQLLRVATGADGTKVHQMQERSVEAIAKLVEGNLYNPHVFGLNARELFFLEDNIVLTEGQEDVLLLPKVAEQLRQEIWGDFFGWGVGGAGNFQHLCCILEDLGFRKVCAILDKDKVGEADKLKGKFPNYCFLVLPADDIRTKPERKSVQKKIGVLDENCEVRPKYSCEMKELFEKMREYQGID